MEEIGKIDLKSEKISTHNVRKIMPFYVEQKGLLSCVVIFMILSGAVGIFTLIMSANALSSLAEENYQIAIKYAIISCSLGIGKIILNALGEYFYVKINLRIQFRLTGIIIDAINNTKMSKLDSVSFGSLTERISTDVKTISDSYLDMINLIINIITNFVFLIYIAFLNFYIFLIMSAYVLVLYFVCSFKSRLWIRGRKITRKAKDVARSAYYEQIHGLRDIKLLNIKDNVTNFSNEKFKHALSVDEKVHFKRNLVRRFQSLLTIVFELIFLLIGIAFVNNNMLFLSGLLVIYAYYGKVESVVSYLSSFKEFKSEAEISATRIFELVDCYEKEEFGTETLSDFSGDIELKNVSFSYDGNNVVLDDVSMEFHPGEVTAIVGRSGSGKTTILNLITKLYDASSGEILLDGKNISLLNENSIRSNIGEVSQSPYIFNASVRQNLLFVKPDASEEEIIRVLDDAQIYNDVAKMPNGMDTEIGENGIKISGGQKQRVAIARLLMMNSKVIVFDESTSALDNSSQSKVTAVLKSLKHNKTVIIVAHRLSSIVDADKIYVLDAGKILCSGTHKWLMKNCEEYRDLYKLEEKNSHGGEENKN